MVFEGQPLKMYFLRILAVACVGLAIYGCNNSEGRQRAKEDKAEPQTVWEKEYKQLTTLSPDASRGVLQIIKIPIDKKDQPVNRRCIVDSLDLANLSYRIIGELNYNSSWDWQTFCGSNRVAYTAFRYGLKNGGVCNRIYLYRITDKTETVLLQSDPEDSSSYWINQLVRYYEIYLPDSIIVYEERVGADIQFAGKPIPMRVVIRRILENGETPIIGTIENAEHPSLSGDGKQVLADRWTEEAPDYYSSTIVVYDLKSEAVVELDLPTRFSRSARRLTDDSPIYYLGAEVSEWGRENIRVHDPQTEVDTALTFGSPPFQISQYYVTADSIVYRLDFPDSQGRIKVKWKTVVFRK